MCLRSISLFIFYSINSVVVAGERDKITFSLEYLQRSFSKYLTVEWLFKICIEHLYQTKKYTVSPHLKFTFIYTCVYAYMLGYRYAWKKWEKCNRVDNLRAFRFFLAHLAIIGNVHELIFLQMLVFLITAVLLYKIMETGLTIEHRPLLTNLIKCHIKL